MSIEISLNGKRTRLQPVVTGRTKADVIRTDDAAIRMVADAANQAWKAGHDEAIRKIAEG